MSARGGRGRPCREHGCNGTYQGNNSCSNAACVVNRLTPTRTPEQGQRRQERRVRQRISGGAIVGGAAVVPPPVAAGTLFPLPPPPPVPAAEARRGNPYAEIPDIVASDSEAAASGSAAAAPAPATAGGGPSRDDLLARLQRANADRDRMVETCLQVMQRAESLQRLVSALAYGMNAELDFFRQHFRDLHADTVDD